MIKKVKRRRKLKKSIKIFLFIFILLIISVIILALTTNKLKEQPPKPTEPQRKSEEIITNILTYNLDTKIDEQFLSWISNNYGQEIIEKLETYLLENEYNPNIWHKLTSNSLIVLQDKYNNNTSDRIREITPKKDNKEIVLSFVGDISLADNWEIMPQYDSRGKKVYGILSEDVVDIMTSSDITVANNEFAITTSNTKLKNKYYTFKAKKERLSIYEEMGVNLVSLANNHIYDYGEKGFNDSLEALKEYDIPYVGAGKNIEEAKAPFYYIINGYKIAFVNATRAEKYILTKEATETSGGVLRCYDPTTFINVIEETKKQSDFVIALVHWGTEYSTKLETAQTETAKQYIDAGADLIVGTHAHTLQGIDFYNNKAILYNLGNFIFNEKTIDTGIVNLKIDNEGNFSYYFLPCLQKDKYTYLLSGTEWNRVLDKMRNLSPNITINEDGEFYQKIILTNH